MKYLLFTLFGLMVHLNAHVLTEKQGNHSGVDGGPKLPDSRKRSSWDDGMSIEDSEDRYHAKRDQGTDFLEELVQTVSDTLSRYIQEPDQRARNTQNPNKKPVAIELNADTVLRGIEKILSSHKVKKIARDLARKAAIVYRAIEKEL